jgi:hypothetical protein
MDLQVGGTSKYKITKEGSSIMTGSFAAPISAKSADYTLTSTDYTIVFDCSTANKTANLPDATTCAGRIYVIKQINGASTYRVTLDGYSTQTIDGSTTWNAQSCNSSVVIQSDGSNWYVIATYNDTSCL